MWKKKEIKAADIVGITAILRDYRNTHESPTLQQEAFRLYSCLRDFGYRVEHIDMPVPAKRK